VKKGSEEKCRYSRSPWIDIIAKENKVYEDIDALKKENDELMSLVDTLNRDVILAYKRNHHIPEEYEDDEFNFLANSSDPGSLFSTSVDFEFSLAKAEQILHPNYDYHFLKDTLKTPLKNRMKEILKADSALIQPQIYTDVEFARLLTPLKCPENPIYKQCFLDNVVESLPDFDSIDQYLNHFFATTYHRHLPLLSQVMLLDTSRRIFDRQTQRIQIQPDMEQEDYTYLSMILIVLKICSIYKDNDLQDQNNAFLKNAYIAAELGEIKTRASVSTLQASLLITSFRMFSHKVSDIELFFGIDLCRDMAIALGIHKNTEIIYELRDSEERRVLQNIKLLLDGGY
jgi:hypothetical protein